MKKLELPNAPKTPRIDFDHLSGDLLISGISVPENSREFYEPIIVWLNDYIKNPADSTRIIFKLSYVNTSSLQFIYDLLMLLDNLSGDKSAVSVDWYYLEDDIDMQEMGEDFRDATKVKFNFFGLENA